MKEKLEKYASLAFSDEEYNYFKNCINSKNYNRARLFLERQIDSLELTLNLNDIQERDVLTKQLEHSYILEEEVLNLFHENYNYNEQVK